MTTISVGFRTDVGKRRSNNEDSYAVLEGQALPETLDCLLVVADGMGGGRGGDVASRIVAQRLPEAICDTHPNRNGHAPTIDPESLLGQAVSRANHAVWAEQVERPETAGMGTTCVAALLQGDRLTVANVGDSRAYLLRGGKLAQITEDHSEVWQQVVAGNMTREQARRSRYRNAITRAVGISAQVEADVETLPLESGDTVLLCSDGLSTELSDGEIARVLATALGPQAASDQLVARALDHGGSDNVTVVVLRYGPFTPLATGVPIDTDEEDTDPEQRWRDSGSQPNSAQAAAGAAAPKPGLPAAQVSRPAGWIGVVIGLLALAVVAEAVGLALLWRRSPPIQPPVRPVPTAPNPLAPPLHADYLRAVEVAPIRLAPAPLVLGPGGDLIAAEPSGALIRISPAGRTTLLSPVRDIGAAPSAPPKSTQTAVAFDSNGTRYQIDPVEKSISKYSPAGTRIASGIGKPTLTSPSALAVDSAGDIYVIDNQRLKLLRVRPAAGMGSLNPLPKAGKPTLGAAHSGAGG